MRNAPNTGDVVVYILRYLGEIILIVAFVHEGNTRKHVRADYFEICFLGKEGEELRFRGGGGRNGRTKLEKGAKNELMSVSVPSSSRLFHIYQLCQL